MLLKLAIFSFLAGAVQVLAPGHWMPLSLAGWQRRWSAGRTLASAFLALSAHLGLGFAMFFGIYAVLLQLPNLNSTLVFKISLAVVMLIFGLRALRFHAVSDVLRLGPGRAWSLLRVLSFLGPCEVIFPILVKSHQQGKGYLIAGGAFSAGVLLVGVGVIAFGRQLWNQPLVLIRAVDWASASRAVLPVATGLTAGLVSLFSL